MILRRLFKINASNDFQRKIFWLFLPAFLSLCIAWRLTELQAGSRTVSLLAAGSFLTFAMITLLIGRLNKDIARRKKDDQKLRQSEFKYRYLVENAAAVIYSSDIFGYINFASDKATELTGYTPEELYGMHFSQLIEPAGLASVTNHYQEQLRSGTRETSLVFLIVTKVGEKKWVEQSVVLLVDQSNAAGFQCVVKDISAQKQMQQDLEASEFKLKENQLWLQSILDNTTSLIFIKDLSGRYILANRQFRELLNLNDADVVRKTDYDFNPEGLADHYKTLDEEVIRNRRSVETEEWVDTRKGKRNLLLIKFPLLDDEGNIFGIGGIATDITERTNYQLELIAATKDAEAAKQMQEQFLANMSHEIRTPMNGIQGMTNLLLDTPLTEQQKEYADIIRRSSSNLLVIINDILDFSKIKAGKLTLEKIDFSIHDVLVNVTAAFAHRVKKKGLELLIDIDPQIPDLLRGDPYRLNQVLVNLVGNALKFTEAGHIRISIKISAPTEKGAGLLFSVTDTGIGIKEEDLSHIFESFSQGGLDTTRRYGGTGLGLAICQQLVRLQDGHMAVSSVPGEGSVFEFGIAYDFCDDAAQPERKGTGINDDMTVIKGKRFLVAEDNEVNQKLIEHVLRKAGGTVQIVANGQEALRELQKDEMFDLVIMDLQMPVMDGYAASRRIRGEMKLDIPIIAMTATALKGEYLRCLEAGMNDYMTKPFEFKDLYRCVAALLGGRTTPVIPSGEAGISSKEQALYDLSLLEELDDKDYLRDILDTFLASAPIQLKEMSEASARKDFDKVYFLSHKLKGSLGMFRSVALQGLLSVIEKNAKARIGTTDTTQMTIKMYDQLAVLLKKERMKLECPPPDAKKLLNIHKFNL